jgi:hypothetical protein
MTTLEIILSITLLIICGLFTLHKLDILEDFFIDSEYSLFSKIIGFILLIIISPFIILYKMFETLWKTWK